MFYVQQQLTSAQKKQEWLQASSVDEQNTENKLKTGMQAWALCTGHYGSYLYSVLCNKANFLPASVTYFRFLWQPAAVLVVTFSSRGYHGHISEGL